MNTDFKYGFWGYFRFYYSILGSRLYLFIALNILVGLLDGVGLALFVPLITMLFDSGAAGSGSIGNVKYLSDALAALNIPLNMSGILLVVALLFSVKGLIRFIQMQFFFRMRFLFIKKIRAAMLQQLNDISYSGFLQLDAGKIQNNLTTEISNLFASMSGYFYTIQYAGILITYYLLAFAANFQFATLVIISGVLSNLLFKKVFSKTQKLSGDVSQKGNFFSSFLIQAVTHFRYLKATNYFKRYLKKLRTVVDETEQLNLKMGRLQALSEGMKEPVAIIVIGTVIYIQFRFFPGSNKSTILVSLLLFYRSLSQLSLLQTSWQHFIQNTGSVRSVTRMIKQMNQLREPPGTLQEEPADIGSIELTDVAVQYDTMTILENVSLSIPLNQTVAFVGESGSGKTTLAHVIIGLIPPTSGSVLIGNRSIETMNLPSYRDKIGYIAQDPVVFNDTIFNNVTFFAPPSPENNARFRNAVRDASLETFIASLPNREQTHVGDNGIYISGGQKQRLSIARELYKNCSLFVLDEATSALDSATENSIQQNLDLLHGNRTVIIIAHRLATIKKADIIYVIKNKTIQARGTFDTLSRESELFRNMIAAQQY
ncbi:ABC transporter ATP-binding protein [Niabella drilacis]|uniref:ATP-binding cassette, subfamily B, MsbA n=1 Tax=Niabella drilacis (strain DSM 25811 / CCM 8410 / CCUG 62505 / LMG 26954 / E90) TaxID=1285928 RepID=A0A1G6YBP1_NIADE|nr:ABC transporter ATP-binding protein [Niabella drilacis]SDD87799.1 ATP-binding cassette, subfamily B, MsbA [Niabella drilacis]